MRKLFIAGNWKMNKGIKETEDFFNELFNLVSDYGKVDIAIAPPFTSIPKAVEVCRTKNILIGAQNMYFEDSGAFTGEISPKFLKELNVDFVILGHSERRHIFNESNELISKKLKKALEEGLTPILCVGETLKEREDEKTEKVLKEQVDSAFNDISPDDAKKVIIAYEPVWAIGTGKTATPEIAKDAHFFIRKRIKELYNSIVADEIRILYGGSVKPGNAKSLLSVDEIDGALIGGASLKPESFAEIIKIGMEV